MQQWVTRYDGPANSDDFATAIVIDKNGNAYVTGRSDASGVFEKYDYATVKYNASGVEQWVARYDGSANFEYEATAIVIAIDNSDNIYVTGESAGSGTSSDYATVKYNASGVEQWVVRYDGPAGSDDKAIAIAIDDSSNVYITGESVGSGTSFDYATVKYNASGVEQWVARYDGPASSEDEAKAIAVDNRGDVYVTGGSTGLGTGDDYTTIKYNALGVEQWVARYEGPASSFDFADAIVVDNNGNVYITGESTSDYATVKYNTSGVQQWVMRYNGPVSLDDFASVIAIDNSGNVYVTGSSNSSGIFENYDYTTVKYNASGMEQWVARYDGTSIARDNASASAIDDSGNIYVTGASEGSNGSSDYATVKYNISGVQQWVMRYDGPAGLQDFASAIAIDNSGNVYVTGSSNNSSGIFTNYDYTTVKYNASGVEQWVAHYDSDGLANAIAVDNNGNVYVTGASTSDYATVKYNTSGVQQWIALYDGSSSSGARAIAVDNNGNVYVTGVSFHSSTSNDYVTIKYNASGAEQWVERYDGPAGSQDDASAIAIDDSGNIYVTGRSEGTGTLEDYATVKYNASGVEQWVVRYDGPAQSDDFATAIVMDNNGNIYVTGASEGNGTSYDYATVKYNASGMEQWVARYDGLVSSRDGANAIALDNNGNVYVTGASFNSDIFDDTDFATVKYNTLGVEQWVARSSFDGSVNAISIDNNGNVYVTGDNGGTGWGVFTAIKYTQDELTSVTTNPVGTFPKEFSLGLNYPNPFNPGTIIPVALPTATNITLKIYTLLGKEVKTVYAGVKNAGEHFLEWDGKNEAGQDVTSGVYLYRLTAGKQETLKGKMILMR